MLLGSNEPHSSQMRTSHGAPNHQPAEASCPQEFHANGFTHGWYLSEEFLGAWAWILRAGLSLVGSLSICYPLCPSRPMNPYRPAPQTGYSTSEFQWYQRLRRGQISRSPRVLTRCCLITTGPEYSHPQGISSGRLRSHPGVVDRKGNQFSKIRHKTSLPALLG
jgi:hypothetical protein